MDKVDEILARVHCKWCGARIDGKCKERCEDANRQISGSRKALSDWLKLRIDDIVFTPKQGAMFAFDSDLQKIVEELGGSNK